jgi:hypothetical protein
MKLLISWSGDRSKHIALAFRQWLPTIIQGLKPWISDVDLQKGSEWNQMLTAELEETLFGLFCLTPESLSSSWLLFEAGAIAKKPGTKRVYTYLFDLADTDVPWPLAQFQSTRPTKEDTLKMLSNMNKHLKEPLEPSVLDTTFNRGWPELEGHLKAVPKKVGADQPKTKVDLMLVEILAYVREQSRKENWVARAAELSRYRASQRVAHASLADLLPSQRTRVEGMGMKSGELPDPGPPEED